MEDPGSEWPKPALTSNSAVTHAVRSDRWRYIRYGDGTEELYDHENDPNEWANLATRSGFEEIKTEHAGWIPSLDEVGQGPPSQRRRGSC